MKFSPDNKLYLGVISVGLLLVIITIALQAAVLSSRVDRPANEGEFATLRREIDSAIEPDDSPATRGQTAGGDVVPVSTATSTPFVIVIPATPIPAATATQLPAVATETPTPIPVLPPATGTPTATVPPPLPTDTAPPPVSAPTSMDVVEAPVPALAMQTEISLAYLSRRVDCLNMSRIVEQLLSTRFQMQVQLMPFDSPTQMFDALAEGSVDVTLCYIDPDDRVLMRERLGRIRQIGVQHDVGEDYKLQIWANGSAKAQLRDNRACVLDFLEKIDFTGLEPGAQEPAGWIQIYRDAISNWLNCSL